MHNKKDFNFFKEIFKDLKSTDLCESVSFESPFDRENKDSSFYLNEKIIENIVIKKIIKSYLDESSYTYLSELDDLLIENYQSYKVLDLTRLGFYADLISLKSFNLKLDIMKVRSYLDHVFLFLNELHKKDVIEFPVELEIGNEGENFFISIVTSLKNSLNFKDYFLMPEIGENIEVDNLLFLALGQTLLMDTESKENDFLRITSVFDNSNEYPSLCFRNNHSRKNRSSHHFIENKIYNSTEIQSSFEELKNKKFNDSYNEIDHVQGDELIDKNSQIVKNNELINNEVDRVKGYHSIDDHVDLIKRDESIDFHADSIDGDDPVDDHAELVKGDEFVDDHAELVRRDEFVDDHAEIIKGDEFVDDHVELVKGDEFVDDHRELVKGDELIDDHVELVKGDELIDDHAELVNGDDLTTEKEKNVIGSNFVQEEKDLVFLASKDADNTIVGINSSVKNQNVKVIKIREEIKGNPEKFLKKIGSSSNDDYIEKISSYIEDESLSDEYKDAFEKMIEMSEALKVMHDLSQNNRLTFNKKINNFEEVLGREKKKKTNYQDELAKVLSDKESAEKKAKKLSNKVSVLEEMVLVQKKRQEDDLFKLSERLKLEEQRYSRIRKENIELKIMETDYKKLQDKEKVLTSSLKSEEEKIKILSARYKNALNELKEKSKNKPSADTGESYVENRDQLIKANNKILELKRKLFQAERKSSAAEQQGANLSLNPGSEQELLNLKQRNERMLKAIKKSKVQMEEMIVEIESLKKKNAA